MRFRNNRNSPAGTCSSRECFPFQAEYDLVDERHEFAGIVEEPGFGIARSPSAGYGSPAKFGLRSITINRFGLLTVSMYGPVPTGYQSRVRFLPSVIPGCE